MSEWSGYLKRAVANVEQRLDKVLESSEVVNGRSATASPAPASPRPTSASPRASIEDRLKRAVGTKPEAKKDTEDQKPESADQNGTSAKEGLDDEARPDESKAEAKDEAKKDTQEGAAQAAVERPAMKVKEATLAKAEPTERAGLPAELQAVPEFKELPDLHPVLHKAQALALSLSAVENDEVKDAALDVVEALQAQVRQFDDFATNLQDRFTVLFSKIKVLSAQEIDRLSGNKKDEQIALLIDEGQRLSQHELKLNMSLKKLRADKAAFDKQLSRANKTVETYHTELTALREQVKELSAAAEESARRETGKQLETLQGQLDEALLELQLTKGRLNGEIAKLQRQLENTVLEKRGAVAELTESRALVEHYRSLAESTSGDAALKNHVDDLQLRLEAARSNHEQAADNWHAIETRLLASVAGLESELEASRVRGDTLQARQRALQDSLKDERSRHGALRAEADALRAGARDAATHAADLGAQLEALTARNRDLEAEAEAAKKEAAAAEEAAAAAAEAAAARAPPGDVAGLSSALSDAADDLPTPRFGSPEPGARSQLERYLETTAVGAAPPGAPADGPPALSAAASADAVSTQPPRSRTPSMSAADLSLVSQASRASIISENSNGVSPALVGRLNLQIRRLENDLAATKIALDTSRRERSAAMADLVKYMDGQDELETLRAESKKAGEWTAQREQLLEKLGQQTELVAELRADIADMKEMYQDQVGTLVDQLQALKGN